MRIPILQVDAFTSSPFRGNPAAVCLLDAERDASWMQDVAREMNLAETAFVAPRGEEFALRWFTPTIEVDLCGHATLASAHALWETGRLAADRPARFHTRSGLLSAERVGDAIEMDFPAEPAVACEPPSPLLAALGVAAKWVGRNRFDCLVEVDTDATVRALRPDPRRLLEIDTRGVIVTAASAAPDADFVSRFFAPRAGIDEDPVTGSAHCCLGPFWAERLGRAALVGHQVSARGGIVRVRLEGTRVRLGGQAVTVLRGELVA